MQKKNNSVERKKYLNKIRTTKILVFITQISILISFIALWEILANKGVIDSFITSQPSRMLETFMNLSQNGLLTGFSPDAKPFLPVSCYLPAY